MSFRFILKSKIINNMNMLKIIMEIPLAMGSFAQVSQFY